MARKLPTFEGLFSLHNVDVNMKFRRAGIQRNIATAFAWALLIAIAACQTTKATGPIYDIRVRHISDEEAYEDHWVHVGEEFFIADTEYSVRVERFVPDFMIDTKTKKVTSRSDKPLNPALQLAVSYRGELMYETWILYQNLLPHMIHQPGYYFQFIAYENIE